MTAQLLSIHIAAETAGPLTAVNEAELVAGCGIRGDRYWAREKPDPASALTLIASEPIEMLNRQHHARLQPEWTRRNITVSDIDLSTLIGQDFLLGETLLHGTELCSPCAGIAAALVAQGVAGGLNPPALLRALVGKTGIRAAIVRGGTVRVGDTLRTAGG